MEELTEKHFDFQESIREICLKIRAVIFEGTYINFLEEVGFFEDISFFENNSIDVLEVGSGFGNKLSVLKRMIGTQAELIGVDLDFQRTQNARQKKEGIDFVCGNATELPIDSKKASSIFFCQILHHLSLEELKIAIKEAKRVLVPSGKLVVVETFKPEVSEGFKRQIFDVLAQIYKTTLGYGKYYNTTQEELVTEMRKQDFQLTNDMKTQNQFNKFLISNLLVFEKVGS
ncbi:class I SAM-dependent methyltransferase [Candidatus Gracilibacteria bacterium]|nr:class I SAM-dependent methyltransferase [Candidatus Gracilibacteria bacterium]